MNASGHYIAYKEKKFGEDALQMIGSANKIIEEYESQGFTLTLRQLYYQFVARGLVENTQKSYSRLGDVINDGRLAGLISWIAIEDRTRNLMGLLTQSSPGEAIRKAAKNFRLDLWEDQDWRPEIWIEKEALAGIIEQIANQLRVNWFACRGYNSQSEQWRAGRRMASYVRKGQRPIVFHLGDHDPSGIDMTRDNSDRLSLFAGYRVQVVRLTLNYSQVQELSPPSNPAKSSDSRYKEYRELYGEESWELDALDPSYLARLINKAVLNMRDPAKWDALLLKETQDRRAIEEMAEEI